MSPDTAAPVGRAGPVRAAPQVERLSGVAGMDGGDAAVGLAEALADVGPVALLEGAGTGAREWSYLVVCPAARLCSRGGRTWLETPGRRVELHDDPCAAVEWLCGHLGLTPDADTTSGGPPFTGGLVGAVAYDLARRLEPVGDIALDDRAVVDLDLRVAETVVALAPGGGEALLVQRPLLSSGERLREVARSIRDRLGGPAPAHHGSPPRAPRRVETTLPAAAYRAAVERALAHIGAGDVFQVNLAQRLSAPWGGSPWQLYRELRSRSPAPHGAVVPLGGGTVVSISPETFLRARGRHVTTCPVKGTRPRAADPDDDRRLAAELTSSAKDRAENVMIVDVERNDLGRVCETGSVVVPRLAELSAHPTVWHLESEVTGRLRAGCGWGDLLRACFPCGSVTGAPKVRAMQLIEALEPVRRGVYCGAVGFLSAGHLRLSVGIRTAMLHGDVADYGAGGGIVADSVPADEHAESLDKAAPFLRAVAATEVVPGPVVRIRP